MYIGDNVIIIATLFIKKVDPNDISSVTNNKVKCVKSNVYTCVLHCRTVPTQINVANKNFPMKDPIYL